jgi:cyclic-di-GMP-binding protein
MPSFDVVSKVDKHELQNAIDQANREIDNRFDFKGSDSRFELKDMIIMMHSSSEFQLQQMTDVLSNKLVKRGIELGYLEFGDVVEQNLRAEQKVTISEGLEKDVAKKLTKHIKDAKLKVQTQIQGDELRVIGKKRDDLQEAIALLKDGDFKTPLQFVNFRD